MERDHARVTQMERNRCKCSIDEVSADLRELRASAREIQAGAIKEENTVNQLRKVVEDLKQQLHTAEVALVISGTNR